MIAHSGDQVASPLALVYGVPYHISSMHDVSCGAWPCHAFTTLPRHDVYRVGSLVHGEGSCRHMSKW